MRRLIFLSFSSLFFLSSALAQHSDKWSKDLLNLQFRSEVKAPSNSKHEPAYNTEYDFAVGQMYNYHFNDRFTLSLGAALSLSSYHMEEPKSEYFISFFKRSEVHHFAIKKARLMQLEVPLLLETTIFQTNNNNRLSFLLGLRNQFLLHSSFKGSLFGAETLVSGNPFFPPRANSLFPAFLNDFKLESGFRWEKPLKNNSILIDLGTQFSLIDKAVSPYLRLGWRF